MLKSIGRWAYNWATVLAAYVIGGLAFLPPILNVFEANIPEILPASYAAAAITAIGVIKGICSLAQGLHALVKGVD